MKPARRTARSCGLLLCALALPGLADEEVRKDVPYVPTPTDTVEQMLELADVRARDVVYDLGCGDGRIVIAAAKRGARGVGVDIDPERIAEARKNAREAGVEDKVQFIQGDLFSVPVHEATVVTLYLLPEVNMRLRPKLLRELRTGTRVVSHAFHMGDWEPEKEATEGMSRLYLWVVPESGERERLLKSGAEAGTAGAGSEVTTL